MKFVDPRLLLGSFAGVVATVFMSIFMLAAHRAGWLHEQAPEEITERSLVRAIHQPVRGRSLDLLATLAHLGFGAAAGAGYVVTLGRWRLPSLPPVANGVLYATSVWLVSYWGVLPRLDLIPIPPRDERRRPLVMLLAHWIYGSVLGLLAPPAETPSPQEPTPAIRAD